MMSSLSLPALPPETSRRSRDSGARPAAAARPRVRVDGLALAFGGKRLRLQGVTYGPFAPNAAGEPLPDLEVVVDDFDRMRDAGVNAVRTYHVPPRWLLDLADERGMFVLIDVPWRKHLCFLESAEARKEARAAVRKAASRGAGHPSAFAYSIGNEIPPDVIRWYGHRRVRRFLSELADTARLAHQQGLFPYGG